MSFLALITMVDEGVSLNQTAPLPCASFCCGGLRQSILPGLCPAELLHRLDHGPESAFVQGEGNDNLGGGPDGLVRRDAMDQLLLADPLSSTEFADDLAVANDVALAFEDDKEDALVLALHTDILALVERELLQHIGDQAGVFGRNDITDAADPAKYPRVVLDAILVRHSGHQLEAVAAKYPQKAISRCRYSGGARRVVQDCQFAEGCTRSEVGR
mmetsp:Transcript_129897/g.376115  ORF Transcript_129897/g.376115 Transcript_129897/m.376115 type:complete len:215 (-) Transcript_129897:1522-2166(-)